MPAQSLLESAQDLALLLGPREADIMRRLWSGGPATVREIHSHLTTDPPLAYTTIMTTCVRLWEKGLLERRSITKADQRKYAWRASVDHRC
jgi:predicted transcriptional regulator